MQLIKYLKKQNNEKIEYTLEVRPGVHEVRIYKYKKDGVDITMVVRDYYKDNLYYSVDTVADLSEGRYRVESRVSMEVFAANLNLVLHMMSNDCIQKSNQALKTDTNEENQNQ